LPPAAGISGGDKVQQRQSVVVSRDSGLPVRLPPGQPTGRRIPARLCRLRCGDDAARLL